MYQIGSTPPPTTTTSSSSYDGNTGYARELVDELELNLCQGDTWDSDEEDYKWEGDPWDEGDYETEECGGYVETHHNPTGLSGESYDGNTGYARELVDELELDLCQGDTWDSDEGDYASSYGASDDEDYNNTAIQAAFSSPSVRSSSSGRPPQNCVVCNNCPVYSREGVYRFVTCSKECLSILCDAGWSTSNCNYCYAQTRSSLSLSSAIHPLQCSQECADLAQNACLMCRCRPANSPHDFCGRTCRNLAVRGAASRKIREVPWGHHTFREVDDILRTSWHNNIPGHGFCPQIRHLYKVIETSEFLRPYNEHMQRVGNQQHRFHGTTRTCLLGSTPYQTDLCPRSDCALCNILRTSFEVSLANPGGAFGKGVYTSSASNKSFTYSNDTGTLLLNKVALGREYHVQSFGEVAALPAGYDSVTFNRENGALQESVVYSNAAIRPVFLLVF